MNKLFALVVALLALSSQACGAAAPPPAPSAPASVAVWVPPAVKPPVSDFSPAKFQELCLPFEVQDSSSWKEKLDKVWQDDREWDKKFEKALGAASRKACSDSAFDLEGWAEGRFLAAGALCDLRYRDGGEASQSFIVIAAPRRDAMLRALDEAKTEKSKDGCVKKIDEAKAHFDKLLKLANEQCSPPSDDQVATSEKSAQEACNKYSQGKLGESDAKSTLERSIAAERAAAPGTRGPARDAREATARSLPTGAALQTAILTGAADFFVERAEQELSLFAAEVLANKLCEKESPVREYLPSTCALLKPCEPQTAECNPQDPVIAATPAALRAAAKADLEKLPTKVAEKIAKHDPNLACAATFSWGVADEVAHGAQLSEVLKDPTSVLARPLVKQYCEKFEEVIQSLAAQIKAKLSGDAAVVAEVLRSGQEERLLRFDAALDPKAKAIVLEVLRRLGELDRAVMAYREAPTPEARVRMVIAAVQVTIPVMTYLADPSDSHPKRREDIYTSVELISQVLNRDYAAAIVTTSKLQTVELLPADTRSLIHLAGSLAQAESSDDVRQTLTDAALPLGSWRRKNQSRWGATLTGMVGFFPAYEKVLETPALDRKLSGGATIAPALLVGTDLHHGLGTNTRFGLQVTLLDLGALASIRFEDPEVEDEAGNEVAASSSGVQAKSNPEVRVEQVFAPGGFLYFGWGPLAFGPAATFVPSLRAANVAGEVKPLDVVRVGAVVAVDVSVLPLF